MAEHHQLTTKRYVEAAAKMELQELKKQEQRERNIATFQFGFAIAVFALSSAAVYTMPNWIPSVEQFLNSVGLMNG